MAPAESLLSEFFLLSLLNDGCWFGGPSDDVYNKKCYRNEICGCVVLFKISVQDNFDTSSHMHVKSLEKQTKKCIRS